MNPEIRYYLSVFIKRLPLFLAVSISISLAGIGAAVLLPTVFKSKASLLVESAQIPDSLAASTVEVEANEQLEIFQQRLLTRANLVEIAREFGVFNENANMSPDEIVGKMRATTSMRSTTGRNRATILEIEFLARNGTISAAVVNEYVTRILSESARLRTRQAGDTMEFFQQEVDRLSVELRVQSKRIIDFQNTNSDALPANLNYRLGRESDLQSRLTQLTREMISIDDQKNRLVQVFESTGQAPVGRLQALSPEEAQLINLQTELSEALSIYSAANPRVKLLQTQVTNLENKVAQNKLEKGTEVSKDDVAASSTNKTVLDVQLTELDSVKEYNQEQIDVIEGEIAVLRESIARTPNVGVELESLERDYENVQLQYNSMTVSLSAAATGERIESLSKGQRITVIEQATPPNEPFSPNRPVIAGAGIMGGVGAAMGLIVLLEILNRSIRRPMDLTNAFGIAPIATVPYIASSADKVRRRIWAMLILLVLVVGIPAIIYYVHLNIYPMDKLVDLFILRLREMDILPTPSIDRNAG
jgi:uncharacterized protein involved in exopolysaccharide biosynthesis